jgi:hypothetical protein
LYNLFFISLVSIQERIFDCQKQSKKQLWLPSIHPLLKKNSPTFYIFIIFNNFNNINNFNNFLNGFNNFNNFYCNQTSPVTNYSNHLKAGLSGFQMVISRTLFGSGILMAAILFFHLKAGLDFFPARLDRFGMNKIFLMTLINKTV